MKILFLTRLFYPHIGGIEKHIEEISKILIKKGHKITVVTTRFDSNLKEKESYEGIEIVRFFQPPIKFIGLLKTWLWLIKNRNLIKDADIVHIHDVFVWYWPLKLIFPNKKVFVTYHGQWGTYPIPFKDKLQKRIGAKFSNCVMCIGKYIPKYYGLAADVISYGAVRTPKVNLRKDPGSLVYVGRLDENTGLTVFLKTLSLLKKAGKLKDFKIEFCGDGELKNECETYGKVYGWVEPTKYFEKAELSFVSGYLSILESLAARCITFAAYKNPLQKDYYEITPFRKYLALTDNPEELYRKLIYAQKNYASYEKLLNEGFALAKEATWDKLVRDYLKLWAN